MAILWTLYSHYKSLHVPKERFSLKPFLALPHCLSSGFPKQKVRRPVAMAYFLAYNNDMLMNLYSHGFQGPKYPVARKCDTLSMLLGSIIVSHENKQLF